PGVQETDHRRRLAAPEEVAPMVVYVCSPRTSATKGARSVSMAAWSDPLRKIKQMKRPSNTRPPSREEIARLEDIPNVSPVIAADTRRRGIRTPSEWPGRDPYAMYDDLCRITGQRHDPCLLDTFIAVVRYMEGGPKKPWWKYTAERKRELAGRNAGSQWCRH